ncbi:type 4b pilus protein PilO2 [Lacisediminimonas sp.]|uniref:type 4b pilus protein PilO2 n=1 Tax=Lacisediminimonas sp. TaxID=3060582 RepID=UPI00271C323E|nr:type 4b pilus protein PilO2 [Lacisediminimonas sp.]MDO8301188.1 type 4b pilus protein PilO2 [Lacisediminimonas sp.]
MSAVHLFEYQRGRPFICGLFWQPLPGVSPSQRKREMLRIAREQAFDLMVLPGTETAQVGYAAEKEGAQRGAVSVAAAFAKAVQEQGLERNLVFAGPVEGDGDSATWYYYAQRDGLILCNGDRIGSEAEVKAMLEADLKESEWETVFAPEAWGIRGSSDRPLTDFLPANSRIEYHRSRRVRPVRTRLRDLLVYWKFAVLVLAVAALVAGLVQWKAARAAAELAAYAQTQRELSALREAELARVAHAWKSVPRALLFARACEDTQKKIATLWPGSWKFDGMSCASGTLTATWQREQNGWAEHLQAVHPEVQIDATGDVGKLVLRLPPLQTEDEAVLPERVRLNQLHQAAQRYGFAIKTNASILPQASKGNETKKLKYDWREVPWSLASGLLAPSAAVEVLDGSGFRIASIDYRYVNGALSWSMKGTQYVQN